MLKISVLIGTRNRPEVVRRCIDSVMMQNYEATEVIVLDDASIPPMDSAPYKDTRYPIRFIRSDTHLGLAVVRNQLIAEATGDVFFIIDDDAYFTDSNSIEQVAKAFEANPELGILAVKIIDYRGNTIRPLTPHSRSHIRQDQTLIDRPHRISYFNGGAHALRRTALQESGTFDEVLMYGHDEIDLAYSVLGCGYEIFYQPEILVHHCPPARESGKKSETAWRLYYLTRNRILFAYKHLPFKYTVPYTMGWLGWYAFRAFKTGLLSTYLRGIGSGVMNLRKLQRKPASDETIAYLKAHYGRLWR